MRNIHQCNCLKDTPYYQCKGIMDSVIDQKKHIFSTISQCIRDRITADAIKELRTMNGNTQSTERKCIEGVRQASYITGITF